MSILSGEMFLNKSKEFSRGKHERGKIMGQINVSQIGTNVAMGKVATIYDKDGTRIQYASNGTGQATYRDNADNRIFVFGGKENCNKAFDLAARLLKYDYDDLENLRAVQSNVCPEDKQ